MKPITLILSWLVAVPAVAELPKGLEKALGDFQPVLQESDHYCKELVLLTIEPTDSGKGVTLIKYNEHGRFLNDEVHDDVNTGKYTEQLYINAVGRTRKVFRDDTLVVQEKIYLFLPILFPWEDKREVLQIVDEDTLIYNFDSYGSTLCTLKRTESAEAFGN